MKDAEKLQIDRIIIHKILKKKDTEEHGFAEHTNDIFNFGTTELDTLKDRICSAFSKSKRFFKLEIASTEKESFFGNASKLKGSTKLEFINKSKNIADLLAISHDRRTIPSGLLLVMDGYYEKTKHFTLVIKAELQEAFTINDVEDKKTVELINDLFLSPAKDFYKIGYIIEEINSGKFPNDKYSSFMYDDNFSRGKRDLAEYFYDKFLGLTSNKNDKLLTKNFYDDFYRFVEGNVAGFENKKGLKNAIRVLYREDITGVINPKEFAELNLNDDLLRKYETEVGKNYEHSFTKNLELIDKSLERGKIFLVEDLKIEGPSDSLQNVNVINAKNIDFDSLKLSIEDGSLRQLITIKTGQK